jgi:hypothetical protein
MNQILLANQKANLGVISTGGGRGNVATILVYFSKVQDIE